MSRGKPYGHKNHLSLEAKLAASYPSDHVHTKDKTSWSELFESSACELLQSNNYSKSNVLPNYKDKKDNYIINVFLSKISVCIINDCIDQLLVLAFKNRKTVENPEGDLTEYQAIDSRYGMITKAQLMNEKIGLEETDLSNIQKEIILLIQLMDTAYKELDVIGTFQGFLMQIDDLLTMQREDELFKDTVNVKKNTLKEIRSLCKEQMKKVEETRKNLSQNYQIKSLECEKYIFNTNGEKDYMFDWETSRFTQHNKKLNELSDYYYEIMSVYEYKTKLENAAHDNLLQYFSISEEDMLNDLQVWSKEYDTKMDSLELQTNKMKIHIENIETEYDENLEVYHKRQHDINGWLAEKREMRRKVEKEKQRIMAATKIQAWWKGVMVRNQLGPFEQIFKQLIKELKERLKAQRAAAKAAAKADTDKKKK